jgi:hypothetical protein
MHIAPGELRVADETDFIDLYGKLRLEPGCTLAEFKQAYRRHVAAWHPDRRRGGRADTIAAARLQRLTAQYSAAMEFHRRHGRLPGAAMVPRVSVVEVASELLPSGDADAVEALDAQRPVETMAADEPGTRVLSTRWWLLIAGVCIAIGAWSLIPASEPADVESDAEPAAAVEHPARARIASFGVGSSESEVLSIEGEPTSRVDGRWEYGPSWVRFENDNVVDWYSSPLRGLHVATPRPPH